MSFKVVRNTSGVIVCFGPNDENYDPGKPYVIESVQPVMPVQIPKTVTMRQAQEALLDDGTLDLVEATLAAMPGIAGKRARIQWTKSTEVRRDWPLVIQLGPIIGKTPEQLDQLFITAAIL